MPASEKLKTGLLLADDIDVDARDQYGTYSLMFKQGLDPSGNQINLTSFRVFEGEPLPEIDAFDAYVISGSRYGVYEGYPWIDRLMDFVRRCWQFDKKVVGICFGHQLIAHALGGKTEKADVGWGFGIHSARLTANKSWMTERDTLNGDVMNLIVIHQDQIIELPPGFQTIAENDFCPNSMIVADGKMLGIQGHPEFSKEFCRFRANFRRKLIGEEIFNETLSSLAEKQTHAPTILKWVNNFLRNELSEKPLYPLPRYPGTPCSGTHSPSGFSPN